MILENAIKAVFNGSLKLKPEESCLIVTDTIKEKIGRAFYNYASSVTSRAHIIIMEPTAEHGVEPPGDIAKMMLQYDVQILVTAKSLTHTKARIEATSRGTRIATMPNITEDIANRCLDIDYEALRKESNRVFDAFKNASKIRVTTRLGTDIEFTMGKTLFFGKDGGSFHQPGSYGNLPEGEVSFTPSDFNGTFVVDASFPGLGLLRSPITFKAKNSLVYEITGERSNEVIERLDRVGPRAYHIAEFGIGLNPKAKVIGYILEDEKVIGTIHIALGNDLSYGGANDVPLHLDGVITKPDILVDGRKFMEKGRFI